MNKQGLVKETTREKVQAAIDKLHYRPNLSARRLAGGNSLFLGLVYHNPSPGYLAKILIGALNGCRANSHHLVLEDLGQRAPFREPEKAAQHLFDVGLDGVIITPPLSNFAPFIEALERLGVAIVKVAPMNIHDEPLRVAMDDALAVKTMLDHMIGLGHRTIGFIKGPPDHPSTHHRFQGFCKTMKEHGIFPGDDYIVEGDFTYRSGFEAAHHFLKLETRPTAIFASNDDMAAGVVSVAHMNGIKVPEDLSVVGFDDTEIASTIWPALTTVKQPISEMSVQAVNLLTAYVRGNREDIAKFTELMDFELVHRDSLAPPTA